MKSKKKIIALLTIFFLSIFINNVNAHPGFTWCPNCVFVVGNVSYTVSECLDLSFVMVGDGFFNMNDTYNFSIVSVGLLNVTFQDTPNDNPDGSSYGETLVVFYTNKTNNQVVFNVGDFKSFSPYAVYRNDSDYSIVSTNATGVMSWNIASLSSAAKWTIKTLTIGSAPVITTNIWTDSGFGKPFLGNINVTVVDDFSSLIDVNITVLGSKFEYFNESVVNGGTTATYSFNLSNTSFTNYFYIMATDQSSNVGYYNTTFEAYAVNITFVNERNGSVFNWTRAKNEGNMSSCLLHVIGGAVTLDLYTNETIYLDYLSTDNDVLRINMSYDDLADTVVRNFDVSLLDSVSTIGLVEFRTQFFEQLIYSFEEKPVAVTNAITGCFISCGYTVYAYENYRSLSVPTINMVYNLYTLDENGNKVLLANIDGTKATLINLDILDYDASIPDIDTLTGSLSLYPYTSSIMKIYYLNLRNDNEYVQFTIYDNADVVYLYTEYASPDEIIIYFYYGSMSFNSNILKVVASVVKVDGSTETLTRYYSLAQAEQIDTPTLAPIAAIISLGFVFFGLTITSKKQVFGIVGIVTVLVGIGITAFAEQVWYIQLIQAIEIILLLFILLVFKEEGASAV